MKTFTQRNRFLLPVLLLAALTGCGSDDNPTAPGDGDPTNWVTITADQDTYLDADAGNVNYGQNGVLRVGPDRHAILAFDLTALPVDAVITAARLRFTQTAVADASGGATVTVTWMPADSWNENTATADNEPNLGSEELGTFTAAALSSGQRQVTFESAPASLKTKHEQLNYNRVLSLRLSSNQNVDFVSGEHDDAGLRPRLQVTYENGTRVVLTPVEDGWTTSNAPDQNMNDSDYVVVNRGFERTFVKFDLTALPDDAQVEMARFQMLAFDGFAYGGDGNVYTHLVTDDSWSATTITASNEPDAEPTRSSSWWLWYDGTDRDAWGVNTSPLLTPVAQGEASGDGTLSLRLHLPGYTTKYYRAVHDVVMKRQSLEVVYTR